MKVGVRLGRTFAPFTVAVAVLILVGHVCAGPVGGHDFFVSTGHTDDTHDGDRHDLSVCEATSSAAATSAEHVQQIRVLVPSPVVVSVPNTPANVSVAFSLDHEAESPLLFLLHAVLLI